MRARAFLRWASFALVAAVAGVACTGGPPGQPPMTGPRVGGSIVIGAEGWQKCLNPITDCAASPWYAYAVEQFVFPRLVQWSNTMEPEPSPLITEVPSLDNGGVTESPFSVTYRLNPKAVWSDGSPITCEDVNFTWKAINNTTGTFGTAGYTTADGVAGISNVNCSGAPNTMTLQFDKVYVDWMNLFGGAGQTFILEKAAFPDENVSEKPDLKNEMQADISFSGGPWIVESWSPEEMVLAHNPKYWGPKPHLDRVTFVPRTEESFELSSILGGDVDVITPHVSGAPLADQFQHNPDVSVVGGDGNAVEALWFQLDEPPVKDPNVRRAFAYAIDRDEVAAAVAGPDNPSARANECGPWIPGQGPWCPATGGPFAVYRYDPVEAMAILEGDDFDCSQVAAGGFCSKDGEPLTVTIATTAGDIREIAIASILQQQAAAAGIQVLIRTLSAVALFSNVAPQGKFQVILRRWGPVIDPSVTAVFSSNQIPTLANGYGGENWDHVRDRTADDLMQQSDQELNVHARAREIRRLGEVLALGLPMLPLDVPRNVAAWRSDRIGGVDPADLSSPYGLLAGLSNWYLLSDG